MLTAKMIGMTPAWLTRSGRNVWPPWYMRRPRTREAYWIGIRRWPSWMKMITATAEMPRMANRTKRARSGLLMNAVSAPGARLTMPAKMMKLMPLPIPFSVISSPSHIRVTDPAVSVAIWVIVSQLPRSNGVVSTLFADRTARMPYAWRSAIGTDR